MSDTENDSMTSIRLERIRNHGGTLRKKNSLYFQKGFEMNFKETQDLRSTVAKKLKNATLKRGEGKRKNSMFSVHSTRKNSMYKTGTLEHRLHSMVDIAHLEFHDVAHDEEEYERKKEKHIQDRNYYQTLNKDPAFSKYHKKCQKKAKKELETFYQDAERELEEIENLLGLDENSLLEIEKEVKSRMEEEAIKIGEKLNNKSENKETEEQEQEQKKPIEEEETKVPEKIEIKEEESATKDI